MRPDGLVNALTVDLEDWFQGLEIGPERWQAFEPRLEAATTRLLALLADAGVHATFFVLGRAAADTPALVRTIHAAGHEIGTHGFDHGFVYRMQTDQFAADLRRSVELLGALTGKPVQGHRAAFFSVTRRCPWAFEILSQHGIRFDSSVFPVHNYRYGIPEAPRGIHWAIPGLAEFPVSTSYSGNVVSVAIPLSALDLATARFQIFVGIGESVTDMAPNGGYLKLGP